MFVRVIVGNNPSVQNAGRHQTCGCFNPNRKIGSTPLVKQCGFRDDKASEITESDIQMSSHVHVVV